jgi:hypothetical protein
MHALSQVRPELGLQKVLYNLTCGLDVTDGMCGGLFSGHVVRSYKTEDDY